MAVPMKEVKAALTASHGVVSVAATSLGITRTALYRRIQRHESLQELCDSERQTMTDLAETKYYLALQKGERWAIELQLKTQGRDRGYFEKQQIDGEVTTKNVQYFKVGDQEFRIG